MTADLAPTSPLAGEEERFAALPAGVALAEEPFGVQLDLRADPAGPAAAAFAEVLGGPLPTRPSTWTAAGPLALAWLGPDEWLVLAPPGTALEAPLRAALAASGAPGAVVDVSCQRTTLRLRGRRTADLLATGCAIDLHPRAFPVDTCVSTTLGLAPVVLLALDGTATDVRILVRASFARYLASWLLDAAVEFAG